MRDLDRWKDKVELQLDGRQIFFLFFGSAIGACMIFVLGVVVGKRVEARSAAHQAAPAADPLAALDELGSTEEGLTFHSTLTEKRPPNRREAPPARDEVRPEVPPSRVAEARAEGEPAVRPRPAEAVAAVDKPARPEKPARAEVAEKPAARPEKADKAEARADKATEKTDKADKADKAVDKADKADKAEAKKGHFTLQLSAFATKSEAVDFVKRLREGGYKPFMIEGQVPGKGLMYRVRLGDYTTREGALTAKGDFERKQKMVAYVAKL